MIKLTPVKNKDGLFELTSVNDNTNKENKMENKEQNKARVIFCQLGRDGKLFGSGEWDNGLQIYANNFRKKGETWVADIDYKTNEVYVNKAGKECFKHELCGMLAYNEGAGKMVIKTPDGKKETVECTPRTVIGKSNGKQYLLLDFSGADKNPFEEELLGTTTLTNEDALDSLSDVPF